MKSKHAECYGYCRICWKTLLFTFDVSGKTVRQIREELNTVHARWGCKDSDVRLVWLDDGKKKVHVQRPVFELDAPV